MAGAKKKQDVAAVELAETLVRVLEARHATGTAEPITLGQLIEQADPQANDRLVSAALRQKAFADRALLGKTPGGTFNLKKAKDAPVALVEDAERLASSAALLQFVLRGKRTPSTEAWGAGDLVKWVSPKLRDSFQRALRRQLQDDALPPGVHYLKIRNEKIFLAETAHPPLAQPQAPVSTAPLEPSPAVALPAPPSLVPPRAAPVSDGAEFAAQFARAFDRLDHQKGSHNLVSLVELRAALPQFSREQFDAGLRKLRLESRFGLSSAESLSGIRPEERQAGIEEAGVLLLHVSRKS